MTVKIEIHQRRYVAGDPPAYLVATSVISVVDIDRHIFVLEVDTDTFSHVAVAEDMVTYPASKATAQAEGLAFYRVDSVTVNCESNVALAVETADYTRYRVSSLVRGYQEMIDNFEGEADYVYPTIS